MLQKTYVLQNVKCGGCGNTITTAIGKIDGVSDVAIDVENDTVSFAYEKETLLPQVVQLLSKLGYPLADAENTLGDKAKSYVSCMIGRVNNMKNSTT